MTTALIGMGRWGKNLARNFHELGALHTICDLTPIDFPGLRVTQDFEVVLANPEIERVVIATPALTHYDLAKQALLAGKDVYVEKPLCTTPEEGEELVALADKHERILMVGHLLHYHPCVQKLKEIISDIGDICYISSHRLNLAPTRPENAIWDLAPHDVSVLLSLCPDLSLQGISASPNIDTALLSFDRAHIYVSWRVPQKEQKLTVQGTKGILVFDDVKPWGEKLTLFQPHSPYEVSRPIEVVQKEPLKEECRHFLSCCETRERPLTDGREGLASIRVLAHTDVLI